MSAPMLPAQAVSIDASDVVVWYKMGAAAYAGEHLSVARYALEHGLRVDPTHWLTTKLLIQVRLLCFTTRFTRGSSDATVPRYWWRWATRWRAQPSLSTRGQSTPVTRAGRGTRQQPALTSAMRSGSGRQALPTICPLEGLTGFGWFCLDQILRGRGLCRSWSSWRLGRSNTRKRSVSVLRSSSRRPTAQGCRKEMGPRSRSHAARLAGATPRAHATT